MRQWYFIQNICTSSTHKFSLGLHLFLLLALNHIECLKWKFLKRFLWIIILDTLFRFSRIQLFSLPLTLHHLLWLQYQTCSEKKNWLSWRSFFERNGLIWNFIRFRLHDVIQIFTFKEYIKWTYEKWFVQSL